MVEDIPETGLHMEIEAPEHARAALVKLANIRDLPRLSAAFDAMVPASRSARGIIEVLPDVGALDPAAGEENGRKRAPITDEFPPFDRRLQSGGR